jgi:hypothetical protein
MKKIQPRKKSTVERIKPKEKSGMKKSAVEHKNQPWKKSSKEEISYGKISH